ncbi:hypothetical protein KAR91_16030 [Candidatus Pacearchaeota archaeon]|nr:hypothetical protein [Candidatus Pacearchaeota archaeon]
MEGLCDTCEGLGTITWIDKIMKGLQGQSHELQTDDNQNQKEDIQRVV